MPRRFSCRTSSSRSRRSEKTGRVHSIDERCVRSASDFLLRIGAGSPLMATHRFGIASRILADSCASAFLQLSLRHEIQHALQFIVADGDMK